MGMTRFPLVTINRSFPLIGAFFFVDPISSTPLPYMLTTTASWPPLSSTGEGST